MEFQDYLWKDISDCHMSEGILGATFKIKTTKGQINMIDYLPKSQARKLYQYAQGKEEEMIEFRRQKELEEKINKVKEQNGVEVHILLQHQITKEYIGMLIQR